MEPRERIFRLLCVHKGPWMQKDIAGKAGCTQAYVSKVMKEFLEEGMISRPYKNQVNLIGFSRLLLKWAAMRKMPQPTYVNPEFAASEIEKKLAGLDGYALTLFSGAWHRTGFMKTERLDAYVDEGFDVEKFGGVSTAPTMLIFYRSSEELDGAERSGGLALVHPAQNYADLASMGGSGMRVASEIAKKYGWF